MPYNIRVVVKAKRISIIIPAYNEERYLGRCLESIAAQTQQVIVVDNGSSDGTAEVARRYPFVTLVRQPKRGRIFAQNTGFNAATGDVLARGDADAIFPADWVERIADYFGQPGAMKTAWTCGARFYNVRFPRVVSWAYGWIAFRFNRLLTGHSSLWGSSMAVPRQAWTAISAEVCTTPDLHEDLDLSIHLYQHDYSIVYDKHTKVGVELRPAYAGPREVWAYLSMWPRTLRRHGIWTWVVCHPVNVVVFVGMPFFGISERLARLFGLTPRNRF
jgi:glycosyltransferase involved in cell wall biosynthesis